MGRWHASAAYKTDWVLQREAEAVARREWARDQIQIILLQEIRDHLAALRRMVAAARRQKPCQHRQPRQPRTATRRMSARTRKRKETV